MVQIFLLRFMLLKFSLKTLVMMLEGGTLNFINYTKKLSVFRTTEVEHKDQKK